MKAMVLGCLLLAACHGGAVSWIGIGLGARAMTSMAERGARPKAGPAPELLPLQTRACWSLQ